MRLIRALRGKEQEFVARLLLAEVLAKRGQGPLQRPKPIHYVRRPTSKKQG